MKLNDKLKTRLKIGASVLAGAGTFYAARESGLSEYLNNYEIWKASFLGGESAKNIADDVMPVLGYIRDGVTGLAVFALTFAGLNYNKLR